MPLSPNAATMAQQGPGKFLQVGTLTRQTGHLPYGVYNLLGRQTLSKQVNVNVIAVSNEMREQEMTLSGNWGGLTSE